MRYVIPSRYEPTGGPVKRAIVRTFATLEVAFWASTTAWTERAVFGRGIGAFIRRLLHLVLRKHLAAIEASFDPAFYLRQFAGPRRSAAGRAPALHYVLIGWRELRAPMPGFDPGFYRRVDPRLGGSSDPLRHYVETGRADGNKRNETERWHDRRPWLPGRPTVLSIHHAWGGGSSRFLDLYEQGIWADGRNVLRLRAITGAPTLAAVEDRGAGGDPPTIVFDLAGERSTLVEFARGRSVDRLLVNHLVGRPPAMMEWLREVSERLGCPYDVVLHDYYALCPRIDMVTGEGRFCDIAPPEACVRCVVNHGSHVPDLDPRTWRRNSLEFLDRADRIIVPSSDLARRMQSHVSRPMSVWAPEHDLELPAEHTPHLRADESLRIATLGALNVSKGVRVLRALAREAASSAAPFAFTVLGPTTERSGLEKAGVTVAGAYVDENLDRLIANAAPHVVFLPAIWPETWSFVLTVALRHGLPVVAFDIGAPAERLRRIGRGHILPLELSTQPGALLAAFSALRQQWGGR